MLTHSWNPYRALINSSTKITIRDLNKNIVIPPQEPKIEGGEVTIYLSVEGRYYVTFATQSISHTYAVDVNDTTNDAVTTTVTTGTVTGDNLILQRTDGTTVNAGNVRGPAGPAGAAGTSATVNVGTTDTGNPGTAALVTPSGTESARVLNFAIPRGDVGPAGPAGQLAGMSLIPGTWMNLNPGDYVTNAGVPANGLVILTPIYIPANLSISSISVYCQTGAVNAMLHIGLYTNVGSTFTRHTLFGTVDGSAAGAKDLAGAWTLPSGILWIGYMNTGAGAAFAGTQRPRGVPGPILAGTAWSGTATTQDNLSLEGPSAQSVLPTSFTSTAMVRTDTPIRFAALKA